MIALLKFAYNYMGDLPPLPPPFGSRAWSFIQTLLHLLYSIKLCSKLLNFCQWFLRRSKNYISNLLINGATDRRYAIRKTTLGCQVPGPLTLILRHVSALVCCSFSRGFHSSMSDVISNGFCPDDIPRSKHDIHGAKFRLIVLYSSICVIFVDLRNLPLVNQGIN